MIEKEITVRKKDGLHARPIAELMKLASNFSSKIFIGHDGQEIEANSVMGIMSLCIVHGSQITLKAEGNDEEMALKSISEFLCSN